ncbi:hypothetical protein GGI12_006103, partial [Dipsacomyces acuminosporus]
DAGSEISSCSSTSNSSNTRSGMGIHQEIFEDAQQISQSAIRVGDINEVDEHITSAKLLAELEAFYSRESGLRVAEHDQIQLLNYVDIKNIRYRSRASSRHDGRAT